jgi:hypothetical protein
MAREAACRTFNCTEGGILFGPGITTSGLDEFLEAARAGRRPAGGQGR